MLATIRHLVLGIVLIAASSAVLLLSDLKSRNRLPAANRPTSTANAPVHGDGPRPVVLPASGQLPWRAQVIVFIETPPSEETLEGLKSGLKENGLVENKDYTLRVRSAQGDMPTISALFDTAITEGTDIFLTLSTPALQNAVRKVTREPVVFTFVTDPMAAKACESYEKHLPNLTGVSTLAPAAEMVDLIKTHFPKWKRIGSLFCPTEVNSVINMKHFQDSAEKAGIHLEAVAANSIGELPDAAQALASRNLDAIVQIADNLSASGFAAISRVCQTRKLPLFAFQSALIDQGAVLALSMDYHQAGADAATKAARIMRGENPATIPISRPSRSVLAINQTLARERGVTVPAELLKKADKVIP